MRLAASKTDFTQQAWRLLHKVVRFGDSTETFVQAHWTLSFNNPSGAELAIPITLTAGLGGAPDFNEWTLFGAERCYRLTDWSQLTVSSDKEWKPYPIAKPASFHGQEQLDALLLAVNGRPHGLPDFAAGLAVQRVVEELLS